VFFDPLDREETPFTKLCDRLRLLNEEELNKVDTFLDMIK
jgi:hypothetical protein